MVYVIKPATCEFTYLCVFKNSNISIKGQNPRGLEAQRTKGISLFNFASQFDRFPAPTMSANLYIALHYLFQVDIIVKTNSNKARAAWDLAMANVAFEST